MVKEIEAAIDPYTILKDLRRRITWRRREFA
jgi:hypothetical protein